ncbi:ubiquitin carboxyl-terminal hydrolase, family 1 [Bombardia bombarda]|uniref:Ubiquitin carboxyl-terminal hydrolase n=1 Tax=Bombardia bombarda TaxID=252184 RepID=A0AA39XBP7_9PEZI|nr:ubiquitin carboxyl-terminal hydrolase, family 1 [Bombardia bombarda]
MPERKEKWVFPLESNPDVFNELQQLFGVPDDLAFEDVFTLDEPDFLPRPALAVILTFPTTPSYETRKVASESSRPVYTGSGDAEPVIWFRQTIHNACGFYALLHALSNSKARTLAAPTSLLNRLIQQSIPLPPDTRAHVLEDSPELEQAYASVATKGDSAVPDSAEDQTDFHYICFVQSQTDGHVYELDGNKKGPVDTGVVLPPGHDMLSPEVIAVIRRYLDQEEGNLGFNIMALVGRGG